MELQIQNHAYGENCVCGKPILNYTWILDCKITENLLSHKIYFLTPMPLKGQL